MTFSIVARDPVSSELGIAVASKFLAAGAVVPWARADVGAIATQALANVRYGPHGLDLLATGLSAAEALDRLTGPDADADQRQAGIVDAAGGAATHTGPACIPWAGGRTAPGVAVQGNILAGPAVVDAMLDAFLGGSGRLAERLVSALLAGDRAGGDARGRQSAAVLVVRAEGGYLGLDDRAIDLRVDDHADPVPELARILAIHRLLWDAADPATLLALDGETATEVRTLLARALAGRRRVAIPPDTSRTLPGTPRPPADDWTADDQAALRFWSSVENLEMRDAGDGWIDPAVLEYLRDSAGS
jgi:uncharacterized Ntn-hydrolase superfamily protein